jgi:hypothetical protein
MAYIYTCQNCSRQYTVFEDGEYICECGRTFQYPAVMSQTRANLTAAVPSYIDSSSRSVRRSVKFHTTTRSRSIARQTECPLAKGALICAIISLFSFGVLSLPAMIMGFAARMMIADKRYHYTGDTAALSGIIIATISFSIWTVWFITLL